MAHQDKQTLNDETNVQNSKDNPRCVKRKHSAVIRLSKSKSVDDIDTLNSVHHQELLKDFARASSIGENVKETPFPQLDVHRENNAITMSENLKDDTRMFNDAKTKLGQRLPTNDRTLSRICSKQLENKEYPHESPSRHSALKDKPLNSCNPINALVDVLPDSIETTVFDKQLLQLSVLNDILEEDEDIISVTVSQDIAKPQVSMMNEYYIRTQFDQKCCSVTGLCAVSNGRILIADEANMNVKLFHCNGKFQSYLKLEAKPWDVTVIDCSEAAVSCPTTKSIHILFVNDTLTLTRTIIQDKCCYGITYHCGEIYIAMENEIRIVTCDGKVVQKISSGTARKTRFSWPLSFSKATFRSAKYISVNNAQTNDVIVVSDSVKACVTSLTRSGQVLSKLRVGVEGVPSGMCFGPGGQLFVCQVPNKLVAINKKGNSNCIKNVLEQDAIQTVHYDASTESLWVTRRAHNFVMVYDVNDYVC